MATQARPTYLMTMIGFVLLATIIPVKSLLPSHNGPSLLASLARNFISNGTKIWPGFPPRLALATLIAASGAVLFAYHPEVAIFWVCLLTIGALLLMTLLWMSKPEGLEDAVLAPAIGLLALAALASPKVDYTLWRTAQLGEEAAYNDIIRPVLALGIVALLVSALAGWRSLGRTSHPRAWSVGAITFAPIMAVLLEVLWGPTVQDDLLCRGHAFERSRPYNRACTHHCHHGLHRGQPKAANSCASRFSRRNRCLWPSGSAFGKLVISGHLLNNPSVPRL